MDEDVRHLLEQRRYSHALERLLNLYETKVFRMALGILNDAGRAEEVTQDIFLKLWQALPAYDGRASLGTWLYAIARNTCLWHRGQNPILTPYTSPILDPSEFAQLEGNASSRHFVYM